MIFEVMLVILVCLVLAFLFGELFYRLNFPRIVGPIAAGIVLGLPVFHSLIFGSGAFSVIEILSEIGIVFLLLLTGVELEIKQIMRYSRAVVLIAVLSAVIPFAVGAGLMYALGYANAFPLSPFIVGSALALTAVTTKAAVLMDFKKMETKIGEIMIGAGAIDAFIGTALLAVTLLLVQQEPVAFQPLNWGLSLLAFIIAILVIIKLLPKVIDIVSREHSDVSIFSVAIILGLAIALLSEAIGLGTVIGALIAGIVINRAAAESVEDKIVKNLKLVTFGLVVPFFFIMIGLNFNLESVLLAPFLTAVILVGAAFGKLVGPLLARAQAGISKAQAWLVGWGLNSRGAIELVIVQLAFSNGLIPSEIYSAVIFMAVVTTLFFPVALKCSLKNNPRVMG